MRITSYPARAPRERGVALIIVLSVILLVTALIVGFLLRAGADRSSTASYSAVASTRQLADMAVNLVQGQINDATNQGTSTAWTSQPGAVRVFDNNGNLLNIYRLYSASSMTTGTGVPASILANDLPPANWAGSPATWVDLNAPESVMGVMDSTGTAAALAYPILDPRNPARPGTSAAPAPLSGSILPGFYLGTADPNIATTGSIPGATAVPGATATQPAPMPVRWMYVLRNGQIISPDTTGTGNSVTFRNASPIPTGTNPLVGRIAFWTDDDTCKVNINTAAGSVSNRPDLIGNLPSNTTTGMALMTPSPWDTPRFGGVWEDIKLFALDQPVAGEYQRYPGHPATTILFNILNGLGVPMADDANPVMNYNESYTMAGNVPNATSTPTTLFNLLPRYNDDFGSNQGMADTTFSSNPTLPTPKGSRLYASLGELLYSGSANSSNPIQRQANLGYNGVSNVSLTRQQMETGKFFLTARSRAPEINLFGTPRVAMWPIPDPNGTTPDGVHTQTTVQSPYDKLIAFCSTTGTSPYYFVRNNRASPTYDGAIPRNVALFGYLHNLTTTVIPGYGGSFAAKYGANNEMDQILTEMVDYIRCTNPYDHSFTSGTTVRYTPGSGTPSLTGGSEVVPLQIVSTTGTTFGLGRIYTMSEAALHIICTADGNSPLGMDTGTNAAVSIPPEWSTSGAAPVSPVVGSANDPLYVSNLTASQFLRTGTSPSFPNGEIVAIDGSQATPATPAKMAFPCNETLSTSGHYVGPNNQTPGAYTPLQPGQKKLQAMLLFEADSPMNGYDWMGADATMNVVGLHGISIDGTTPFPATRANTTGPNSNGDGILIRQTNQTGLSTWGGVSGFDGMMNYIGNTPYPLSTGTLQTNFRYNSWSGRGVLIPPTTSSTDTMGTSATGTDAFAPLGAPSEPYPYVSNPFTASSSGTMPISGGCTVNLVMPINTGTAYGTGTNYVTYQTFNVSFANVKQPPAPPDLPQWGIDYVKLNNPGITLISHAPDWWGFDNRIGWDSYTLTPYSNSTLYLTAPTLGWACVVRTDNNPPPTTGSAAWTYKGTHGYITPFAGAPSDVVRSVFAIDGDYRITAAKSVVNADGLHDFRTLTGTSSKLMHLLRDGRQSSNSNVIPGSDLGGKLAAGVTYSPAWVPKVPSVPVTSASSIQLMNDWDNGTPACADGAYSNWPDDGNIYVSGGVAPYYNGQGQVTGANFFSYFTPNRIMPSPVMFGSLPTGVTEDIPWRTLLFRPSLNRPNDPAGGQLGPPDYLLLDLFDMPVVEPYAISEPFSTAGKINMNYQIVPFTYITRDTGVRAVLGSELVARIPTASETAVGNNPTPYIKGVVWETTGASESSLYFSGSGPRQARLSLNLDETYGTLRQFQDKFAAWNVFRSPAEICSIYLVPYDSTNTSLYTNWMTTGTGGPPYTNADNSWYGSDFAGVGDNVRERPYADIYPRLTTKSNTYTVYYTVQSIKNTSSDPTQWNETTGAVLGEYRGSTSLERYLDPNDPQIPDYANPNTTPAAQTSIEQYYKWRVISNDAFAP